MNSMSILSITIINIKIYVGFIFYKYKRVYYLFFLTIFVKLNIQIFILFVELASIHSLNFKYVYVRIINKKFKTPCMKALYL